METKETITKDNYKEKTLKRAIIVCWVLLAICFVVKICGGNFFNIICNNKNFIKFCNYCDTSFIRYIIYFIYFMFESTILLLIIRPDVKIRSKRFLFYSISVFIFWIIKNLYEQGIIVLNVILATVIPLCVLYLLLLVFSKRPYMSLFMVLYELLLATISSIIKSISLTGTLSDSFLLYFIFNIDYYILLIIPLLYARLKFKKGK